MASVTSSNPRVCLVEQWLTGIGLDYAWPHFEAAGIVTPNALASLDVTVFVALGVQDPEHRRKLFYLVQRIKLAVEKRVNNGEGAGGEEPIDTDAMDQMLEDTLEQPQQQQLELQFVPSSSSNSNPQQAPQQSRSLDFEEQEEKEEHKFDDDNNNGPKMKATQVQEARRSLARKVSSPRSKPLTLSPRSPNSNNNTTTSNPSTATTKTNHSVPSQRRAPQPRPTTARTAATTTTAQRKNPGSTRPNTQTQTTQRTSPQRTAPARTGSTPTSSTTTTNRATTRPGQTTTTSKNNNSNTRGGRTSLPQPSATKSRLPVNKPQTRSTPAPTSRKPTTAQPKMGRQAVAEKDENKQNDVMNERHIANDSIDDNMDGHLDEQQDESSAQGQEEEEEVVEEPSSPDVIARRTRSAMSREQTKKRPSTDGLTTPRSNRATEARTARSRLKTPSNTNTATTPSSRTTTNSAAAARTAKAQPKSNRTGKVLSAIPSDRILPMSPLMDIQTKKSPDNKNKIPNDGQRAERRNSNSSQSSTGSRSKRRTRKSGISPTSDSFDHSDSERSTSSRNSTGSGRRNHAAPAGVTVRKRDNTASSSNNNRRKTTVGIGRRDVGNNNCHPALVRNNSRNRNAPDPNSFKAQIEDLRDDHAEEHDLFVKNATFEEEEDMRIRVVVRKRPMSNAEVNAAGDVDVIHPLDYQSYGRVLVYQPKTRVDLTKEIDTIPFAFDNVFDETSNNTQIYERSVRNLIAPLFEGQWGCVFAYGQTGSGKTFTMMGSNMTTSAARSSRGLDRKNLGLYYMAALDLFQVLSTDGYEDFTVGVSLFEIYGGKLFDLLNKRRQIKALEDGQNKVRFPGLGERSLANAEQLIDIIEEGASKRSTGSTSRNADSSRSHAVLQLHIYEPTRNGRRTAKRVTELSRLTFIDLAGSERGADTSAADRGTRREGAEINTSLLALKEVIRAMATGDSMRHVPFRGSKLTQVLKESFVGANCRSVMVACVSPNIGNCEQTLNTLRYANRVKERNPENGQLSSAVAKAKQPPGSSPKPITPRPEASRSTTRTNSEDGGGHRRGGSAHIMSPSSQSDEEDCADEEDEDFGPLSPSKLSLRRVQSDAESATSFNSVLLDDLLGEKAEGLFFEPDPAGIAAQQVILTHRETMTSLVETIQQESTLHVQTNGMEDYIASVNEIHQRQLASIDLLRERIREYRSLRENGSNTKDDEEEDLRD